MGTRKRQRSDHPRRARLARPDRAARTLTIVPDARALAVRAGAAIARVLRDAVGARGRASLVLAGGDTPGGAYRQLAVHHRDRVPWADLDVFWGDERCVPPDDTRSNSRMARTSLLDHVAVDPLRVHPMCTGGSSLAAAAAYERLIEAYFRGAPPRFDLVLLGLGADGHTASLFPGSTALASARWVAAVRAPVGPRTRVTLTPALLLQARTTFVLVSGRRKAAALRSAMAGDADVDLVPAALLARSRGRVRWWVDAPAARLLTAGSSRRR